MLQRSLVRVAWRTGLESIVLIRRALVAARASKMGRVLRATVCDNNNNINMDVTSGSSSSEQMFAAVGGGGEKQSSCHQDQRGCSGVPHLHRHSKPTSVRASPSAC